MTQTNVLHSHQLSEAQNGELRALWDDCAGVLHGSAWQAFGHPQFPRTIGQLELITDNESGVTQVQLDNFIEDIRYGQRCTVCASTDDVDYAGRCGDHGIERGDNA